ncbi:hypothetical protein [Aeromicrobium sp. UC242_57]|uniref:hypothetical protein n=1 Tax=Aeromicrobium sp. UC242_57 TaxID=3374624 RepID=UPI0037A9F13F
MRSFNDSTAKVATVLEGEREDLKATLEALSLALVDVNSLVKENRGALRGNVDNIASLAKVLAKHKDDLADITINAPTALTNVALAYNGKSGTLDTRADIPEVVFGVLDNPASLVCNLLGETLNEQGLCSTLSGLLPSLLPRTEVASQGGGQPAPVNQSLEEMLAVN